MARKKSASASRRLVECWRLCKEKHSHDPLTGIGAERYGGRWNFPGNRVVYAASTLSLALAELLVHIDTDLVPEDYMSVKIGVQADASREVISASELPRHWRAYPGPRELQALGTEWLVQPGRSILLDVPSAIVPSDRNLLINPLHREFRKVTVLEVAPFRIDPRLFR